MRRLHALPYLLLATLCISTQLPTVRAGISYTGNVDPDPNTWTSSTDGYVGKTTDGTLTVDADSDLNSRYGYIGYEGIATGEVTVTGTGSTWTNADLLDIGYSGSGTLNITGGAAVSNSWGCIGDHFGSTGVVTVDGIGSTWTNESLSVGFFGSGTLNITSGGAVTVAGTTRVVVSDWGSTGTINFGASGGTLTTGSLAASSSQLTGTGMINARGLVSNIDLMFDSTHGLKQTLTFNQSGQDVTANLDMASDPSSNGVLGAGWHGGGSLTIREGVAVQSQSGVISWTGVATVDGTGSTWTNGSSLTVGNLFGTGTLNITGGGAVEAASIWIDSQSLLAIDVGNGSLLTVGGGTIYNGEMARVIAGAGPTTGNVHSPISAGTWSGSGVYQAVGGTWNETTHEFTVSGVQSGNSGVMETIDLASTQRALIADGETGWSLGASFLAMDVSTTLNLTATAIEGETLADLEALIVSGESVLGAWELIVAGDGYTAGDPAYLSFDIGAGFSRSGLQVWHFDGVDWTEFDAMDLTYDGTYASFTVTGFSGYAVSTVPEPGTLVLLIAAALGLLAWVRKKRQDR